MFNSKDHSSGFTLIEVMISIVFLLTAATAVVSGVVHVSKTLTEVNLKESAFEILKNKTDDLKAAVMSGDGAYISPNNCDPNVCLKNGLDSKCPDFFQAELCYSISPANIKSVKAQAFEIVTHITWTGPFDKERDLSFYAVQMDVNLRENL